MRAFIPFVVLGCSLALTAETNRQAKRKIPKAQAEKAALAKHLGKIKSSELETEHGKLIYSFDIQTKDGIYEVGVDANDGSVVEDKKESAKDEAKEQAADKAEKAKAAKKH